VGFVQFWRTRNARPYSFSLDASVGKICEIYLNSEEMAAAGVQIYSTDEKMAIQAIEHTTPKTPMQSCQIERIDPDYERHGTTGIIASQNVATGEIVCPLIQPTRKEEDYLTHIESVVSLNPTNRHIFINDNLNTHCSESLVRFVAHIEAIDDSSLGVKGKSGILATMESRAMFLSDDSHHIVFVYTPKHCSWLNRIECWFSIITRRLLNRRASFLSAVDLELKIRDFISYYNQFLKKPFNWTFTGFPAAV